MNSWAREQRVRLEFFAPITTRSFFNGLTFKTTFEDTNMYTRHATNRNYAMQQRHYFCLFRETFCANQRCSASSPVLNPFPGNLSINNQWVLKIHLFLEVRRGKQNQGRLDLSNLTVHYPLLNSVPASVHSTRRLLCFRRRHSNRPRVLPWTKIYWY